MFHKLHLQLAFINVAIITTLFFFLTTGTYFYLKSDMITRASIAANRLAADLDAGHPALPAPGGFFPHVFPGHHNGPELPSLPGPPFFPGPPVAFVTLDAAGAITSSSLAGTVGPNDLAPLVQHALQSGNTQATLTWDGTHYLYFRIQLQNPPQTLMVFQNFDHETTTLHTLVIALTVIGLLCLILSLFGSLFIGNRAMIPIKQAWQQQTDFLADASHELRTPLAVIQTNLEIVLDSQTEIAAGQNRWLNNIKEESKHMTKLVNSLLFLARADANQQFIDKTFFSINTLITSIAGAFELIVRSKNIALHVSAAAETSVYGDPSKIKQVLEILLDNAIRHTPAGGEISIGIDSTPKSVTLTVADNGEGIPPAHRDKIFDRFYQVDRARSTGKAGLGLSIARYIIKQHGGTIKVDSLPGQGATFVITLPQRPPD